MTPLILIGTFFVLLILRVPVAASMWLAAVACMTSLGFKLSVLPTVFYAAIAKYTLLAIPFFILAGVIMDYAGISSRLIDFANACVGHRKGGLAVVTVVVACFFAAISGSGPATVAAIGGVLIPAMADKGYNKNFATALVASSGGIGMIIPPSIPFIIYAMLAGEVSVGTMFIAGIVPGLLFGLAFSLSALACLRRDENVVRQPRQSWGERWRTFRAAIWALLMPIIILGGIYGGIFTPTEAAGVAVVYGLFVGLFVYREIKLRQLWNIFVEASVSSAVIMFIMGCAGAFTWILTTSGVAKQLTGDLLAITHDRTLMLLLITVIFLIAGCFVDSASGFYLLMPILLPIIKEMAFGVIATANFALGQVTPPVGSNLFVACNIAKISMRDLVSRVWPFLIAGIICLLLITYFPWLITFLPAAMGMKL